MNKKITFRIDDVSSNTDIAKLNKIISYLKDNFDCQVWNCVTHLSKNCNSGSVYPNPPFKNMDKNEFYKVNNFINKDKLNILGDKFVSHGLVHADHSRISYDAQEMSIVSSCNLLFTNIFVPPFNRYNEDTENICKENSIRLIRSKDEGWRSLEHEPFDESHDLWYFHPWRFTFQEFINVVKVKMSA